MALASNVDRLGTTGGTMMGHAGRPCLAIAGSVLTFALLIERAGFLPAVLSTVLVASLASRELSALQAVILAVALAAALAGLFVGLLGQPFTLIAGT